MAERLRGLTRSVTLKERVATVTTQDRRAFLQTAGLASVSLLGCQQGAVPDRPNVLLVITDQQTDEAMSCTGNPHISTPAMDRIAARGVRFTRSYVTQPLCLPCRSSIQTGRYPHEIGTSTNGVAMNGEYPMLGKLMQAGGYDTAYFGKWHVAASFEAAGYPENSEETRSDSIAADKAIESLRNTRDKPFFLTVSVRNPHDVCQLARRQDLPQGPIPPLPDDEAQLPPLPANFAIPENEPTAIRASQERNSDFHYPTGDWSDLEWRQYLWGYYRLAEKADHEIGRVLDALRDTGHEDNTVIIFTSDHGEGVASHHWNQKQILYEQAVRVPLLIADPQAINPGSTSDALVSTGIDLMPAILDFASLPSPPEPVHGRSLRPLVQGIETAWDRPYVVAETTFARGRDGGASGRMVRTERYKYIVYDEGSEREQLFDLEVDPHEMRNLATTSEFQAELNEHRKLILEWATKTDDAFPWVEPA